MTRSHVAVDHIDPDTLETTTAYYGTCTQAHVDKVRAIAALPDSDRFVKEHPRLEGAFCVLRDDGDLDVYVPVDAAELRIYAPDPLPKSRNEGGDLAGDDAQFVKRKSTGTYTAEDLLPRGVSGPAYITGAVRFGDQSIGGASDSPTKPPRVVWHTTESPAGGGYFLSIAAYLMRVGAEPQVIYDPVTDRIGQFGPLTQSARALRNSGSYRTNRTGKVCIQVEVLGYAKAPWTKGFDPAAKPNYQRLIAANRAHGVPDVWPVGKPPGTAAAATVRPKDVWENQGGNYGHSQIFGQDHWDPGAIDTSLVPGKPASTPAPAPAPKPPATGGTTSSSTTTYTVRAGDTLSAIATKYKTTVAKLVSLNRLRDPDDLDVGQKLKIPAPAAPVSSYEPFPGAAFFHTGRTSPIVTAMGRRLVAVGCGRYSTGPGPNYTLADRKSYAAWQRRLGYSGDAADGVPGKTSWDRLRVPKQL